MVCHLGSRHDLKLFRTVRICFLFISCCAMKLSNRTLFSITSPLGMGFESRGGAVRNFAYTPSKRGPGGGGLSTLVRNPEYDLGEPSPR